MEVCLICRNGAVSVAEMGLCLGLINGGIYTEMGLCLGLINGGIYTEMGPCLGLINGDI